MSAEQRGGPPRLQLELNVSTTSFKRSFDELGLDLDEPATSSSTQGSQHTSCGLESEHDDDSNSPSSSRSSKRARSEDLESESSYGEASGSGTHAQRENSLSVELGPIQSISPIMDSFSLPWQSSPVLPGRAPINEDDNETEQPN